MYMYMCVCVRERERERYICIDSERGRGGRPPPFHDRSRAAPAEPCAAIAAFGCTVSTITSKVSTGASKHLYQANPRTVACF